MVSQNYLEDMIRTKQSSLAGNDPNAELYLNDARDYIAGCLPTVDPRARSSLLIYCPTSLLVRALFNRFFWRLKRRLSPW